MVLLGFLGSAPSSMMGMIMYLLCCAPFLVDLGVSALNMARRSRQEEVVGGATVEELNESEEEDYAPADREALGQSTEQVAPSDRLVPAEFSAVPPVHNLLTSDWKEGASDENFSQMKQVVAYALIAAQLFLGSQVVAHTDSPNLGIVSLTYGTASLAGYFGLANIPVMRLARVNGIALVAAFMGIGSILTGGLDLMIFLLTVVNLFDAY